MLKVFKINNSSYLYSIHGSINTVTNMTDTVIQRTSLTYCFLLFKRIKSK